MGGLGPPELLIILAIVLVLFGARKLPEIGDSLGKSIKSFRKATEEASDDTDDERTASTTPSDDQEA